jgi:hypothetical protein
LYLKSILLIVANLGLVVFFICLLRKPGRLSYYLNGRWWLLGPDLIWRTFHDHRFLN